MGMRYRFKKQAARGDIARLSFLVWCAYAFLWARSAFVPVDPEAFITILLLEQMAVVSVFTVRGGIFDFTDAPKDPKGWAASTFLERK